MMRRRASDRPVVSLMGGLFFLGGALLFGAELSTATKNIWVLVFAFVVACFGASLISQEAVIGRLERLGVIARRVWKGGTDELPKP